MNLRAIEAASAVAKQLAGLRTSEQLQVLLFLTEMTKRDATETTQEEEPVAPVRKTKSAKPTDLITLDEACKLRGVQKSSIQKLASNGRIANYGTRFDGRYSRAELTAIPMGPTHAQRTTKDAPTATGSADDLMSVKDASRATGLRESSIFRHINMGNLAAQGTRNKRIVSKSALLALGIIPRKKRSKKGA